MKTFNLKNSIHSKSGFITADFLFSFVLVISIGIIIFTISFSLATIEIAQYIVWSSARAYAAGNLTEAASIKQGEDKFNALAAQFPALTGSGSSPWFTLGEFKVGDLTKGGLDADFISTVPSLSDQTNNFRQPWTGARAVLDLKMFGTMKIPFLGKMIADPNLLKIPVRAFLIRSPSTDECKIFFYLNRYKEGIKKLSFTDRSASTILSPTSAIDLPIEATNNQMGYGEDNGC